MTITDWMQAHRRSILFLLALLVIGGLASSYILPVALFPHVDFPRVVVSLEAGDRPAERMGIEVTWPVEEAVRAVPGVCGIRSVTSRGASEISINFDWKENMVAAMLQVESEVNKTLPHLPSGTTFTVVRMDPTTFPVLGYTLTSDTHSLVELRDIAMYQLRPLLSTVEGVAKIAVLGGDEQEYHVIIDPAKLNSFGLALDDVSKALSASNVITAVGRLEDHYKLYLIMSDTRLADRKQILDTVIRTGKNGVVLLEDVATVSSSVVPAWTRVTADGHDAVIFQVHQQPGGNTVQIARELKEKLGAFKSQIPADVRIANWYDQSELIVASAVSVRDAVLVGVVLGAVILLIFLRSVKITLIAIVAVPGVLAATVLLLYVLHMSFNIMTLGGMAAAVGLIIDDNIVMIEQIIRRLREGTGNHRERIMQGALEFARPLAGSSASTIIIFAPLAFLSGVTGSFFKALSLTMASSLVISFLVSWLAVPLLADHLLTQKDAEKEENGRITRLFHRAYEALMRPLLAGPWLVLLIIVPLIGAGWICYNRVGSGFMPKMDEGGFILDYVAPAGTSLTETDRLLRQLEKLVKETPEVQTYSRRTGIQLGGMVTEANEGDYFIRLKPYPRRNIEEVMDDLRGRIEKSIPGLEIEMPQLMEDLIGDLTAVPQPIEIKLYSDDVNLLMKTAPKVAAAIEKVSGVVEVKNGIVLAGDALNIQVDRVKASLEGMDPDAITTLLNNHLTGSVTTQIQHGPKMVGVRVWIPQKERSTDRDIAHLRLRAPDGHLFPLSRVASVQTIVGQPQIMRDDLKQMLAVTGRISGRDLGSTIREIKTTLNKSGLLPKGVYYSFGGLYAEQQKAFAGLLAVFVAAIMLVFLLLLFLYERFRMAIAMLATTLLAFCAVLIGLWLTDTEINITAMMGMTMVVGIVTEVAIFYASEYFDLPADRDERTTLIKAGKNRMRPIAMTTVAAILALLPLALGVGQGSSMQQPLAIAIISGLVVQTPLVLIVLPVLMVILHLRRSPAT